MGFIVGDSVFDRQGRPNLITSQNKDTDEFNVTTEDKPVKKSTRHGYINGLSKQDKEEFLGIMDTVKESKDPEKRLEELRVRIDDSRKDPKNHRLTQYLESEYFHIMNSSGIKPKDYTIYPEKVPANF